MTTMTPTHGRPGVSRLADDDLLNRARAARNGRGEMFTILSDVPATNGTLVYRTSTSKGVTTAAGALEDLLSTLAFWSNRDPQQMERLLRRSARWDALLERPAKTAPRLVDNAIAWAIAGCLSAYGDDMPSGSWRDSRPTTAASPNWGTVLGNGRITAWGRR